MTSQFSSIRAILLSTALFLMGNGLVGTLTSLRGHLDGFSDLEIGVLGACYFAGFVLGCFAGPHLLARAGHIRTFAVCAALAAATVLVQPIYTTPLVWFAARAVGGFCNANLFMALESWLNDRATNETRGRLLSYYVIVNLSSLILGQWLLLAANPLSFEVFSLGAIVYCLCLAPVGMTRLPQPAPAQSPTLRLKRLLTISPVGAAGVIAGGLANSAFWVFAPVYVNGLGFSTRGLALFMTVFIAGGALIQWPLGRFSDRVDRRWIIAGICAVCCVAGIALAILGGTTLRTSILLYIFIAIFGASMLPLYSLSIAHANDRLPRSEFVEASAGLLFLSALASVFGPLLVSFVIAVGGTQTLFLYTATVHAAMVIFAATRIFTHAAPWNETREPFEPVPQGSPASLPLDPRAPEHAS